MTLLDYVMRYKNKKNKSRNEIEIIDCPRDYIENIDKNCYKGGCGACWGREYVEPKEVNEI